MSEFDIPPRPKFPWGCLITFILVVGAFVFLGVRGCVKRHTEQGTTLAHVINPNCQIPYSVCKNVIYNQSDEDFTPYPVIYGDESKAMGDEKLHEYSVRINPRKQKCP